MLFVGTKRQAQDVIAEEAGRSGMYLRQRAVAGRAADQLHHHPAQYRAPPRSRGDGHRRPLRVHAEERDRARGKGKAQAAQESRRHPQHGAAARCVVCRRHAQGKDRGRRGAQIEDSGHRHRRHQLRSRRSGLRDSGQRRCAAVDSSVRRARGRCRFSMVAASANPRWPNRRRRMPKPRPPTKRAAPCARQTCAARSARAETPTPATSA